MSTHANLYLLLDTDSFSPWAIFRSWHHFLFLDNIEKKSRSFEYFWKYYGKWSKSKCSIFHNIFKYMIFERHLPNNGVKGKFSYEAFVVVCWLLSKVTFSKYSFRSTISVSNGLDPVQDQIVCKGLSLSANNKRSGERDKINNFFFLSTCAYPGIFVRGVGGGGGGGGGGGRGRGSGQSDKKSFFLSSAQGGSL